MIGLIPVVGEVADLANAAWYTAEGDYTMAALSAAAAIPFAGWAATGAKVGVKGARALKAADAARTAGDDATQLFRAVGRAEADDIAASGVYRNPPGLEGKYFYPTQEQAENLAATYSKMGLGEHTVTSGRISTDLLRRSAEPISPAGEGSAFFIRNDVLPNITDVRSLP